MAAAVHQDIGRHPASIVTYVVNAHYSEKLPEIDPHVSQDQIQDLFNERDARTPP
jgi:hypothetical protein